MFCDIFVYIFMLCFAHLGVPLILVRFLQNMTNPRMTLQVMQIKGPVINC
jgi:hypothetical protein